jgi:GrpB-like predicted nucleotidyltransferase (UPF0157 family)
MPDAVRLRDFDPSADRVALERLWVAAIGSVWPVLPAGLDFLRTGVVAARAERAGVTIEDQAGPDPAAEVLAFEAANFPNWLRSFQRATSPVLVARDRGGGIAGTLLFRGPPDATIFMPMLGADAGTIGCVGVAAAARGPVWAVPWWRGRRRCCGTRGPASATSAGPSGSGSTAGSATFRGGATTWPNGRSRADGSARRHPSEERARMNEEELRAAWVVEPPRLRGKIQVVDYDQAWPELFRREAARILEALGERVVLLEHVGSTSVPGLAAKPIIDVLLIVPDSSDEPAWLPDLEAAGYVLVIREPDRYQHRCLKGPDTNVNLHVYSPGCPEIERYLIFRDRLRGSSEDRVHYQRVKRELAERDWTYVQEYADAKTEVVEEIIARARKAGTGAEAQAGG